jgi:hypothetical protein
LENDSPALLLFTVVSPDAPMNLLLGPTIAGLIGMLPLLAFALVLMLNWAHCGQRRKDQQAQAFKRLLKVF